jgi:putative hydrolase of the HAD superfamily
VVVFDLDEVLCDYDFALRLGRLSELCGLEPAEIEARIWTSGFDEAADQGRYDLEEYCRLTCEKLEADISYEALLSARIASMRRNEDVLALVRALEGQVTRAMLTNNGPFLAQGIERILPDLDALFGQHAYFSGVLGLAKPDPAAFLAVVERMGADPTRTLFIDDTADYIAGAGRAGLMTHQFVGAPALKACLADLGLRV